MAEGGEKTKCLGLSFPYCDKLYQVPDPERDYLGEWWKGKPSETYKHKPVDDLDAD